MKILIAGAGIAGAIVGDVRLTGAAARAIAAAAVGLRK